MNNGSFTLPHYNDTISIKKSLRIKSKLYSCTKRFIDILAGITGMLILIPLTIVIKIVSLINKDYNSIFYTQDRIGKDGKTFKLYKYRTMVPDADNILYQLMQTDEEFKKEYTLNKKAKNDPRITKIGKILRKTSLDEFPQFINVFLGQMSLVGNRPYLPREKEDMGEYYDEIIKTKPGITGLWQTSGRSNTTFDERLQIERRYSRIHNMKLDIEIFFKTIVQVIKKDGAN